MEIAPGPTKTSQFQANPDVFVLFLCDLSLAIVSFSSLLRLLLLPSWTATC